MMFLSIRFSTHNAVLSVIVKHHKTIITKSDKKFMVSYAEKYICDYITSENKDNFNYINYTNMVKRDVLNKCLAYNEKDLSFFKFYFFLIQNTMSTNQDINLTCCQIF